MYSLEKFEYLGMQYVFGTVFDAVAHAGKNTLFIVSDSGHLSKLVLDDETGRFQNALNVSRCVDWKKATTKGKQR